MLLEATGCVVSEEPGLNQSGSSVINCCMDALVIEQMKESDMNK